MLESFLVATMQKQKLEDGTANRGMDMAEKAVMEMNNSSTGYLSSLSLRSPLLSLDLFISLLYPDLFIFCILFSREKT